MFKMYQYSICCCTSWRNTHYLFFVIARTTTNASFFRRSQTCKLCACQCRRDVDPNDYDASSDEEDVATAATPKPHNRKLSGSIGAMSNRSGAAAVPTCTPMQRLMPIAPAHMRGSSIASSMTATTDEDARSDGAPIDVVDGGRGRGGSQHNGSIIGSTDDAVSVYSAASSNVGGGGRLMVNGVSGPSGGLHQMETAVSPSPRNQQRHQLSQPTTAPGGAGGGPRHRHLDSIAAMAGNNGGRALMAPSENGSADNGSEVSGHGTMRLLSTLLVTLRSIN